MRDNIKMAVLFFALVVSTYTALQSCGNREVKSVRVGDVWIYSFDEDPFKEPSPDTNTVLAVSNGYVQYRNEYVFHGKPWCVTNSTWLKRFVLDSKKVSP